MPSSIFPMRVVAPVKWSNASLRIVFPALEWETRRNVANFFSRVLFHEKALLYDEMISTSNFKGYAVLVKEIISGHAAIRQPERLTNVIRCMINQTDGMKKRKFILLAIIVLLAGSLTSPAIIHAWMWNGQEMGRVSEPFDLALFKTSQHESTMNDLDCLELHDVSVTIHRCNDEAPSTNWVSPADWQVKRSSVGILTAMAWKILGCWYGDFSNRGRSINSSQMRVGFQLSIIIRDLAVISS